MELLSVVHRILSSCFLHDYEYEWNGLCLCKVMGYGMVFGVYTALRAVIWTFYVKVPNLR